MRTFRKPYSSRDTSTDIDQSDEVTLTRSSFHQETDINNIMSRYQSTGVIEHLRKNEDDGQYGDVPSQSFHDAMNLVTETQQRFDAMPASTRAKFGHSAGQFLEYVQDPKNVDSLIDMGLLDPLQPVESVTPPVDPAPPDPAPPDPAPLDPVPPVVQKK